MGISVEGLSKRFGSVQAVAGVDLELDQGQTMVLLGQNGAGKSTTLRCLGGVLHFDFGRVSFDSLSLPTDVASVRRQLGVVTDQPRLYGRLTAAQYLDHFAHLYGMDRRDRRRRIAALLERFGLSESASQPLWAYSRGMAQKVALIRATVHDPRWIFLDEPTAGLDPLAASQMRAYLNEHRERGAALIVTTHILGEAEMMADRIAIMREGRLVESGALEEVKQRRLGDRVFTAYLPGGERRRIVAAAGTRDSELAEEAARLQAELKAAGRPYFKLEEEPRSLERVYLEAQGAPVEQAPRASQIPSPPALGLRFTSLAGSLAQEPRRLAHLLPFYLNSWWRRGDLSWVLYLNAFVLLVIAATSEFGSLPPSMRTLEPLLGKGTPGALLLPLFFMSFALLESIKSSIGIWWEKAQGSLEVLLFAPLDDASLIWTEVLPGMVVSAVWCAGWTAAGLALLALFGQAAPWGLLGVFTLVAALTAYWAAMGRLLGFLLFPREGAAGGAWSFLLSPVSAAVADIPLALFVFKVPMAALGLLLPAFACFALTSLTAAVFDRERLLDPGVDWERRAGTGLALPNLGAVGLGLLAAAVPAALAGLYVHLSGAHSFEELLNGSRIPASVALTSPPARASISLASALVSGVSALLALSLGLLFLTFAAFFLFGLPQAMAVLVGGVVWGAELGFGPSDPLFIATLLAGGTALLAVALNTGASLPVYFAVVQSRGERLSRLRWAWRDYLRLYRWLVLPACLLFSGAVVLLLVAS